MKVSLLMLFLPAARHTLELEIVVSPIELLKRLEALLLHVVIQLISVLTLKFIFFFVVLYPSLDCVGSSSARKQWTWPYLADGAFLSAIQFSVRIIVSVIPSRKTTVLCCLLVPLT